MYRLRKIKELKKYRFFQDFKWDENGCNLFDKYNIIYGWNGSGKTTLCDLFRELEIGQLSDEEISFSLLFEDTDNGNNTTITQSKLGTIPYFFKVFHQNYIQENIATADPVKHIFAVGKGQKEMIDEVKRLKDDLKQQKVTLELLKRELAGQKESFEQLKSAKAKIIKDAAQYTGAYNKNKFYSAWEALTVRQLLSDDEYQKAIAAIRAEKRPPITFLRNNFIQASVRDYVHAILVESPVNATIDALKNDTQISSWVEQGLSLHTKRQSEICLFCGNRVSKVRFDELRAHFNKSYMELSNKIDGAISLLNDKIVQFETVRSTMPDAALLYPELQDQYIPLLERAQECCLHYISVIKDVIELLKKKKSDMINPDYSGAFLELIDSLTFDYSIFESINKIIGAHNSKTEEFQKSIYDAQKKVENHHISEFFDEVALHKDKIENKKQEVVEQQDVCDSLAQSIRGIEKDIRNSQIPADEINKDISFIMGRSELVFKNSDLGYQITRNGKKAKNLSKGEENAVALIYFFNTLLDVDADSQRTIIVLDDPISSFDSNFYYNAISYIREKTEHVGQTFIFTHKFSLLKDYSKMYRGSTNRYILQRVYSSPQLTNEDRIISQYHDEYAFLFRKVYEFVKNPPSDTSEYLVYPNLARRLLESFLTFKLPKPEDQSNLMGKVLELEGSQKTAAGRAVLRLLNNHSHLRVIPDIGNADDIDSISTLPDTLKNLLEFMRCHDKVHYDTLAELCDPQYNKEGDAVEIEHHTLYKVKLFEVPASAGPGDFLEENIPAEEIKVSNPECSFAVRISGDSMEPRIPDGGIALVKKCEEVPNAHIGIVLYNGQAFCKKIIQSNDKLLLVSLNKQYDPIEVTSSDQFHVFGEVLEVLDLSEISV